MTFSFVCAHMLWRIPCHPATATVRLEIGATLRPPGTNVAPDTGPAPPLLAAGRKGWESGCALGLGSFGVVDGIAGSRLEGARLRGSGIGWRMEGVLVPGIMGA